MRAQWPFHTRDDAGSGAMWVLALALVVLAVGLAASLRVAAVVARHSAESAADFAALAAAVHAVDGPDKACSSAASIARENGATLVSCELDGAVATVEVTRRIGGRLPDDWIAHARARAGPTWPDSS